MPALQQDKGYRKARRIVDRQALAELAEVVASGECIWFVGSGCSLESGLPGAAKLGWMMLEAALFDSACPLTEPQRVDLWETLKRSLLGRQYRRWSRLRPQRTLDGVRGEIEVIKQAQRQRLKESWVDPFNQLGRVADVVKRAVDHTGRPWTTLASFMQLLDAGDWDKDPSFAHHLLAHLVLEGCVREAFTTNYDDLIERACEAVGATHRSVRSDVEFQGARQGGQVQDLLLYKIHGCIRSYRDAQASGLPDKVEEAARQLVITDRQLQTWRGDEWSRQLVATALRSKPFLFAGYSAVDVVMDVMLNNIAEKLETVDGKLFVAPELTFPFYQFFTEHVSGFDPLRPDRVLRAYFGPLMMLTYPQVMQKLFEQEAAAAGTMGEEAARDTYSCTDSELLTEAGRQAVKVLAFWAGCAAESIMEDSYDLRPKIFPSTPLQVMVRGIRSELSSRLAEPLRLHKDQYQLLAKVLSVTLAGHFGTRRALEHLRFWFDPRDAEGYRTLNLDSPGGGGEPIRLVLLPRRVGIPPRVQLKDAIEEYFRFRQRKGLARDGWFVFLMAADLEPGQILQVLGEVQAYTTRHTRMHIWCTSGHAEQ